MTTAASRRLARRVRLVLSLAAAQEAYGAILEESPLDLSGSIGVLRRLDAIVGVGSELLFEECRAQGLTPADDPPARIEQADGADLRIVTFANRAIFVDEEGNVARL